MMTRDWVTAVRAIWLTIPRGPRSLLNALSRSTPYSDRSMVLSSPPQWLALAPLATSGYTMSTSELVLSVSWHREKVAASKSIRMLWNMGRQTVRFLSTDWLDTDRLAPCGEFLQLTRGLAQVWSLGGSQKVWPSAIEQRPKMLFNAGRILSGTCSCILYFHIPHRPSGWMGIRFYLSCSQWLNGFLKPNL